MAIPLHKPVRRKTAAVYRVLFNQPRQIIVSLAPGDVLEFREAGRRAIFRLPIDAAFRYAVRLQAEAAARKKREERKAKRNSRLKSR